MNWIPRLDFRKENWRWTLMDRYILIKFLGSVFYSIALLMTIIVVFDISEKIHKFLDNEVPLNAIIFQYYFNFIPYFINLFFPLFTFISVIWFTSKLSGNNEIISFFNGGVSFYRFMYPYIVGALILSVLSLFMANFVIPKTNARMHTFYEEHLHKKRIITNSNIHFKSSEDTYVYAERWMKQAKEGERFTVEVIDYKNEKMKSKLSAAQVSYNDSTQKWHLYDYTIRNFDKNGQTVRSGVEMDTTFNFLPDDFNNDITITETMSYFDLLRFIDKEKKKGSSLVKHYQIERHKRIANPLSILIMTLLGLSVAARKTRRGVGVHIFIGLFFVFTFILFQQVSNVFAISEQLAPAMATWLPNLVYLVICLILLRFTPK